MKLKKVIVTESVLLERIDKVLSKIGKEPGKKNSTKWRRWASKSDWVRLFELQDDLYLWSQGEFDKIKERNYVEDRTGNESWVCDGCKYLRQETSEDIRCAKFKKNLDYGISFPQPRALDECYVTYSKVDNREV